MKIGFIGLGNVGGKLAGSLLRSGFDLTVRDLNRDAAQPFLSVGTHWGESPAGMMEAADAVITCLPNPAASAAVLEAGEGLLSTMGVGTIWMEMSTTDEAEVRRLGEKVRALGGEPVDCPVSGGCHRADTGNISIFAVFSQRLGLISPSAQDLKRSTRYFSSSSPRPNRCVRNVQALPRGIAIECMFRLPCIVGCERRGRPPGHPSAIALPARLRLPGARRQECATGLGRARRRAGLDSRNVSMHRPAMQPDGTWNGVR